MFSSGRRGLLLVAAVFVYLNNLCVSLSSSTDLGSTLAFYTGSSTIAACLILGGSLLFVTLAFGDATLPHYKFIWHCFIRPLN
ncbi:hypothetical protein V8E55_010395 [Tylopilus felleus]